MLEIEDNLQDDPPPRPLLLLVDDEKAHLESLERIFQRAGHDVITAENGDQAIECLRKHPVAVVLTDLVMPDRWSGWQAANLTPSSLVVMMTAYVRSIMLCRHSAGGLGFCDQTH